MKFWYRRGAVAWLLWPASLVFGFFVFLRRILYFLGVLKSHHPGLPVIVVGNLTIGGAGKTPLVIGGLQRFTEQTIDSTSPADTPGSG